MSEPSKLHILIVDDHEDTVELLAFFLRDAGHRVDTATAAPRAIELATTIGFDAAVIDISIPEQDGYAIARTIISTCGDARPVLVAVSGHASPADAQRGREAGFDIYLTKPVDLVQLERTLVESSTKSCT